MPVQDLTPQLRTRLSRVERLVGWFVLLATLVFLAGFGYYIHHTAKAKGWFLTKIPFYTYLKDATGLRAGDAVRMMGFDVGTITLITATEPEWWYTVNEYNVFVAFEVVEPYYGYIWTDSRARVGTGDLLGKRVLEITKGSTGEVTVIQSEGAPIFVHDDRPGRMNDYRPLKTQTNGWWIPSAESPALTERIDTVVDDVQAALPGILDLTNQLSALLSQTTTLASTASASLIQVEPLLSNLTQLASAMNSRPGVLGEWLIPTNLNAQLDSALDSAESLIRSTDTNVTAVSSNLNQSLVHLANITSNLNAQVQANDRLVSQISSVIVTANDFLNGLRGHWLFRRAFEQETSRSTNRPPRRPPPIQNRRW